MFPRDVQPSNVELPIFVIVPDRYTFLREAQPLKLLYRVCIESGIHTVSIEVLFLNASDIFITG